MLKVVQSAPDGGTFYAETNLQHLFPEPLNTITSCFFLGIAIYWTFKLWGNFKSQPFISYALMLLYIGGIGGTTYHAFRQWSIFIMMDWLPIMLLCISAGVYFIAKLTRWYFAAIVILAYLSFQVALRDQFKGADFQVFVNINYALMASIVLLPVLVYLFKTRWLHGKWVAIALFAFIIALTFRIADKWQVLNVGTHFLWHTFGAVASFCMFNYIYLVDREKEFSPSTH